MARLFIVLSSVARRTVAISDRAQLKQSPSISCNFLVYVVALRYSGEALPPESQWRSFSTTTAIERLHEEFKRRIKTQTVLPSADTAAMLFWALLASGQSTCARSMVGKVWPQSPSIS
jgi:hypothetical protein